MCVTLWLAIVRSTSSASKPGRITCVAPRLSVDSAIGPAAWVIGAETSATGLSVRPPMPSAAVSIIVPQPRLVTLAPFDGPVVPPVGKMPTRSIMLPKASISISVKSAAETPSMNWSSEGSPSHAASRQMKCVSVGQSALSSRTSSTFDEW